MLLPCHEKQPADIAESLGADVTYMAAVLTIAVDIKELRLLILSHF